MSCRSELKKLMKEAKGSRDSDFKDGYLAALEEAIDIVDDHEDEGE